MQSHRPSYNARPIAWLALFACLVAGFAWPNHGAAQDATEVDSPLCQDADLKALEGEVADLAREVGEQLVVLDSNMSDLNAKPSLLFERSQAFWLKSRKAACAAETEAQADTCLCETGLARRDDLTKLHQTLQTAVATAQEN